MKQTEITEVIKIILGDKALFCFLMGSASTERFHSESDIDLAVFWESAMNFEAENELKNKLEESFQRDVDLVALNDIDPIFGRQVLETGRLILNNSNTDLLTWKAEQLSKYPDFKASRNVIEKNILKRKKYV